MKKTRQLQNMIHSTKLEFVMESHNGLSAKIAQEAGFSALWASGLSISASLGVRDNNEASWTQILEIVEFMSDATTVPILFDGDTGFGNFNNVRRLVRKLEQRDIAGVCIEDKIFPKCNSFINGDKQLLADADEFSGKIKAAKDTQRDDDFVVVARTESFITGQGLGEALRRAETYRNAGADAVLIHSKKATVEEIDVFMREWDNRHPVIIVPTTYVSTPVQVFKDLNLSMVIWANHSLRAGITAMQETCKNIFELESASVVEENIANLQEVFRLQNTKEMMQAEEKYLFAAPAAETVLEC